MSVKKICIGCGSLFSGCLVLLVVLFIALGVGVEQGFFPDAVAQPKGKIPQRQLDRLVEMGVVDEEETVEFYYSTALFSLEKDGNLFTDRRVISFQKEGENLKVYEATYAEIAELEFTESESWEDDSLISVTKTDGDWFLLVVSPEEGRDTLFFERLKKRWDASKSGRTGEGVQEEGN